MEPIAVDVNTAAKMTSLSPHTIRLHIRKGLLKATRVGRRVVIPVEALKDLVHGSADATDRET